KLFERFGRAGKRAAAYDTRELITAATMAELRTRFEDALRACFAPLEIVAADDAIDAPRLSGDGAWLEVPSPTEEGSLRCHHRDRRRARGPRGGPPRARARRRPRHRLDRARRDDARALRARPREPHARAPREHDERAEARHRDDPLRVRSRRGRARGIGLERR